MSTNLMEYMPVIAADGAKSAVTVFPGTPDNPNAVVLFMPAMGVSADYYEPLSAEFARRGAALVSADLRGVGKSSVRASRRMQFGYYDMVQYDWPAYVAAVKKRFPDILFLLGGHSLGGQLSALFVSTNPGVVDGLLLIAASSVYFKGWNFPHDWGVLASTRLIRGLAEILGYFPGKRLGFGGTESLKVVRDWSRQARTGRYQLDGSPHDFEALLKQVELPVLAVSFADDYFAPKKAVKNLCDKMSSARLSHWHIQPLDLGLDELGHFKWVRNASPLVERIHEWISRNVCPRCER